MEARALLLAMRKVSLGPPVKETRIHQPAGQAGQALFRPRIRQIRAYVHVSPLTPFRRMLGRLDAGREPTGTPMFFGGSCSTGFRYSFAVHLLLGPVAEERQDVRGDKYKGYYNSHPFGGGGLAPPSHTQQAPRSITSKDGISRRQLRGGGEGGRGSQARPTSQGKRTR
jgi:hypothetical protein